MLLDRNRNENKYRFLFLAGAVWNWGVAVALWAVDWMAGPQEPNPLGSPLILQLYLCLTFVFGLGFLSVSRNIYENHVLVKLGLFAKLLTCAVIGYHLAAAEAPSVLVLVGIGDLAFVVFFFEFLVNFQKKFGSREFLSGS